MKYALLLLSLVAHAESGSSGTRGGDEPFGPDQHHWSCDGYNKVDADNRELLNLVLGVAPGIRNELANKLNHTRIRHRNQKELVDGVIAYNYETLEPEVLFEKSAVHFEYSFTAQASMYVGDTWTSNEDYKVVAKISLSAATFDGDRKLHAGVVSFTTAEGESKSLPISCYIYENKDRDTR